MRLSEHLYYQQREIDLVADMRTRKENWNTFEDIVSIITRPITNWYMFANRDGLKEDVELKNRLRRVAKVKSTAVRKSGTNPSTLFILGLNEVGIFTLVKDD